MKKGIYFKLGCIWLIHLVWGAPIAWAQLGLSTKIAFLADVHLQDVYADIEGSGFEGLYHPKSGKMATIRTMKSQLNSTRLFNENYFAFLSALEELRKDSIKIVVLPGDFTDDGQPMNVLAVKRILDQYATQYGMRFFLTTGNHDPVMPFGGIAGKNDFMGADGKEQVIQGAASTDSSAAITDQINYWGYYDICVELANFGFYPHQKDIFWSHPFLELDYDNYDFKQLSAQADMKHRLFELYNTGYYLPDASYVVEPVEGIWLLALDGNVYHPVQMEGNDTTQVSWKGSGLGFNQTLLQKDFQLKWIRKVSEEAKKRGKTLISFSHYPLTEFHDGATPDMIQLFGSHKFQLQRVPNPEVSEAYANAGIQVHFAGHMHINDTEVFQAKSGEKLFNIQVPSLAAFPPAYKILTLKAPHQFEINTQLLFDVPSMNAFFDLYAMEHDWLLENQPSNIWQKDILKSTNYHDYTLHHLKELIRLRFIPSDWPDTLAIALNRLSRKELLTWAKFNDDEGAEWLEGKLYKTVKIIRSSNPADLVDVDHQLIRDFYLVKNADVFGKELIEEKDLAFYHLLIELSAAKSESSGNKLNDQLKLFLKIFNQMLNTYPSDHFMIDLKDQSINTLK